MQFDQRETIGFQAAQLAKLVAQLMREALGPLGIQPAQAAALIEIGARPGLSQKELVERLEVEQPGVARTLNGLYLSDRAAAIVPEAARIAAAVNRRVLAGLTRTEQAHLVDALEALNSELKAG
jgi:DNA-binding MarR family transcriptional regulator